MGGGEEPPFRMVSMGGSRDMPQAQPHHGEVGMQAFVKHQMTVIMQPFIDQVQHMDVRMHGFEDHLEHWEKNAAEIRGALKTVRGSVEDLRGLIRATDARADTLRENLERQASDHLNVHKSVEHTNGWLQRVENHVRDVARSAAESRTSLGDHEVRLHALEAVSENVEDERTDGALHAIDVLTKAVKDLKTDLARASGDASHLREDVRSRGQLLQETRALLDQTVTTLNAHQKNNVLQAAREAETMKQIEGFKNQLSRVQPTVEALQKDAAYLKQHMKQQQEAVHTLQQNGAIVHGGHEDLKDAHDRLSREVEQAHKQLSVSKDGHADLHALISRTNALTATLQTSVQDVTNQLQKAGARIEGLEKKQAALGENLEKAGLATAEVRRECRMNAADAAGLRHELEKASEALEGLRGEIHATSDRLSGLSSDLGSTAESMHRLDSSMELCKAGLTGLQKGFVDAGTHFQTRPITLPRLPKEDRYGVRSPKVPHTARQPSPLAARASLGGAGGAPPGSVFAAPQQQAGGGVTGP
mmetsp:Transcript_30817/g.89583  ORF Transcript_30817/g.89583 Transcript_30817/m.89583 type:complete len:531 (-) Transcript_30817:552-2144(-)